VRRSMLLPVILGLLVLVGITNTLFTINETEQAIIVQFGKYVRSVQDPGLHFKLPFLQTVHRFESRLLTADAPEVEYITRDKKRVVVDHVSRWLIVDPLEFYRTVRTEAGALSRLNDILVARLRQEIAQHDFIDFVREQRESIMETVTLSSRDLTRPFGIELVDVRIKRVDLPKEVQASVFARMQAERRRIATRYRAEGEEQGRQIRAEADKEREMSLAKAYEEAQKLTGEGDAEATRIYAEAYERDPEFYAFLRRLETYEKTLDDQTMIVIPSDADFLRYLQSPRGR